jgi:hypothetical protein
MARGTDLVVFLYLRHDPFRRDHYSSEIGYEMVMALPASHFYPYHIRAAGVEPLDISCSLLVLAWPNCTFVESTNPKTKKAPLQGLWKGVYWALLQLSEKGGQWTPEGNSELIN